MPIDSNIYSRFAQPVRSVQDYQADYEREDQNALAGMLRKQQVEQGRMQMDQSRMQMEQARQERERQNQLIRLIQGLPADAAPKVRAQTIRAAGFLKEADDVEDTALKRAKDQADIDSKAATSEKARFEVAQKGFDAYKASAGRLRGVPNLTKPMVLGEVQQLVMAGLLPAETAQQLTASLPDDPAQLSQAVEMAFRSQLSPEQILTAFAPKPVQVDDGQRLAFRDTNPNSPTYGQTTAGGVTQKMATPGDVLASQDRQTKLRQDAEDAAAGREIQRQRLNRVGGSGAAGAPSAGQPGAPMATDAAPALGVPVPTVFPWASQTTPAAADRMRAAELARGAKEVEKDTEEAKKARDAAAQAQRFMALNQKIPTGEVIDKIGAGQWVQSLKPEYASMLEITASLAPNMRPPGAGATSDFDAKQYERATVGVDKPKLTNDNIARSIIARSQLSDDYAEFRNAYLEQNLTLAGADRFWKQYVEKNPIFDRAKPDQFALNPKRQNWREFFSGAQAAPGRPAAPAPAADGNSGPAVGTVQGGYRFKGGNPADAKNWEKV